MREEIVLRGKRFDVVRVTQATDTGPLVREVVRHPGAVTILPLVDREHICLIKNYRVAVKQTLIELPAGTLEPSEPPLATARRELIEETGYRAQQWHALPPFYMSPGILDEQMYLYVAQELSPGPPAREAGEQIENLVVTWDECDRLLRDGQIMDAKSIVGLLMGRRWLNDTREGVPG